MPDLSPTHYRLNDLKLRWQQDPSSRLFLQLADEHRKLGQHADAVAVLEQGLGHRPNDLSALVALGRCRLELEKAEEAVEPLEAVVSRDPTHIVASKLLIEAHLQRGDAARAAERLETYRLLNDRDPELNHLEYRLDRLRAEEEQEAPTVAGEEIADEPEIASVESEARLDDAGSEESTSDGESPIDTAVNLESATEPAPEAPSRVWERFEPEMAEPSDATSAIEEEDSEPSLPAQEDVSPEADFAATESQAPEPEVREVEVSEPLLSATNEPFPLARQPLSQGAASSDFGTLWDQLDKPSQPPEPFHGLTTLDAGSHWDQLSAEGIFSFPDTTTQQKHSTSAEPEASSPSALEEDLAISPVTSASAESVEAETSQEDVLEEAEPQAAEVEALEPSEPAEPAASDAVLELSQAEDAEPEPDDRVEMIEPEASEPGEDIEPEAVDSEVDDSAEALEMAEAAEVEAGESAEASDLEASEAEVIESDSPEFSDPQPVESENARDVVEASPEDSSDSADVTSIAGALAAGIATAGAAAVAKNTAEAQEEAAPDEPEPHSISDSDPSPAGDPVEDSAQEAEAEVFSSAESVMEPLALSPEPTVDDAKAPEDLVSSASSTEEPATATLGELYLKQGHHEEAERIFRKVLEQDPDHRVAQDHLARLSRQQNENFLASPPGGPLSAADLLAVRTVGGKIPEGLTAKKVLVLSNYAKHLRASAIRPEASVDGV